MQVTDPDGSRVELFARTAVPRVRPRCAASSCTSSARDFYERTLGLEPRAKARGRSAQFEAGQAFVCLERKGSEPCPSRDKAVLFFDVDDFGGVVERIGRDRILGVICKGGRSPAVGGPSRPGGDTMWCLSGPQTTLRPGKAWAWRG